MSTFPGFLVWWWTRYIDLPTRRAVYREAVGIGKYQVWWTDSPLWVRLRWRWHGFRNAYLRHLRPNTRPYFERIEVLKPR